MVVGLTQMPRPNGITQIAATCRHNLALRSDGHVRAWGLNYDGHLGKGARDTEWPPVEVTGPSHVGAMTVGVTSSAGPTSQGRGIDDGKTSNTTGVTPMTPALTETPPPAGSASLVTHSRMITPFFFPAGTS